MANAIHHVTAISGSGPRNIDFYTRVLGLRLVKRTVDFDEPTIGHLYYGDGAGRPGSLLTFFPIAHAAPGRLGVGAVQETVWCVPAASLGYWTHRFLEKGVAHETPTKRFGESILAFKDPDGTPLALAGVPGLEGVPGWEGGGVEPGHAIRGLHSVSLLLEEAGPTAAILTDVFGFAETAREGTTIRHAIAGERLGAIVDLRAVGGFLKPRTGRGSVHHLAFRARDEAEQAALVRRLREGHGIETSEQKDRRYFRSVYFEEPGHVLFEIATDAPGFSVDEPADALGAALQVPPFLEERRAELESRHADLA
ncbi:ring-cleaving dioxygenase [Aurantimonas sp. Leaf443]|uniref:ring-cleaving dioxygenase n=1 Tax=Aurantimonas sp. Leaf443 TaxID=1736378 RepID=UPI0006FE2ACC|nr:ring-cleaving dioxygenase [Aurantimonas sp. Leaf443]KQT85263.1 diguanylate cyclase [Aurantimonas sp. Leaf443]